MVKQKIKDATMPKLESQTIYQLTQMKSFVDSSLKEAASQSFESQEAKIKYLLESLYTIRDFVISQTTENSLRIALIQQFAQIEQEEILGNDSQQQEEKSLANPEEPPV